MGENGFGVFLSCSYFLLSCCVYLACCLISWPMLEPVPLTTEFFKVLNLFLSGLLLFSCSLTVVGWLTDTRTENTFSEGKGPLWLSVVWNWCFQTMGTRCLTTADTRERSVFTSAGCAEAVDWAKAAVAFARNHSASPFIPARQCCWSLWLCRSSVQVSLSAAFALAPCDSALRPVCSVCGRHQVGLLRWQQGGNSARPTNINGFSERKDWKAECDTSVKQRSPSDTNRKHLTFITHHGKVTASSVRVTWRFQRFCE